MSEPFELHPQLAADCLPLGEAPLCRWLLMNDANYPWCLLVPRRGGAREIYELNEADQAQLLRESARLGRAMMQVFAGDKLNVAALGNITPQLHVHHIVRRSGDAAWPMPVWGRQPPLRYSAQARAECVEALQKAVPEWCV